MFIADLFLTTKTWKQSKYPSAGKMLYKLWYIKTMESYSVLKEKQASRSSKDREDPYMHITK